MTTYLISLGTGHICHLQTIRTYWAPFSVHFTFLTTRNCTFSGQGTICYSARSRRHCISPPLVTHAFLYTRVPSLSFPSSRWVSWTFAMQTLKVLDGLCSISRECSPLCTETTCNIRWRCSDRWDDIIFVCYFILKSTVIEVRMNFPSITQAS